MWQQILLLVLAATVALYLLGRLRWHLATRSLHRRLDIRHSATATTLPAEEHLDDLPPPVELYLRQVISARPPRMTAARIRHRGQFSLSNSEPKWIPFTSTQRVVLQQPGVISPGFVWDARITMPLGPLPFGPSVRVHDAYTRGEGHLHASLFGLLPLANAEPTPELAVGELMRFLAEAVWYPAALLPSRGVRWLALDAHSARATLTDDATPTGSTSVHLDFHFDTDGHVREVKTHARPRLVDNESVPTPWRCRLWDYQQHPSGVWIPMSGEVAWVLPEGPLPYWRGKIVDVEYEVAE